MLSIHMLDMITQNCSLLPECLAHDDELQSKCLQPNDPLVVCSPVEFMLIAVALQVLLLLA